MSAIIRGLFSYYYFIFDYSINAMSSINKTTSVMKPIGRQADTQIGRPDMNVDKVDVSTKFHSFSYRRLSPRHRSTLL